MPLIAPNFGDSTAPTRLLYMVVVNCVQSEGSRHANGYEGLNTADIEPVQIHHSPDHYAELDNRIHGSGLDRHGYIEVIADPEYDGQPQVCLQCYKLYHSECDSCL